MKQPEGIYILVTKSPSVGSEYRVAALESEVNLYEGPDDDGKWLPNKHVLMQAFGRAPVFDLPMFALSHAQQVRSTLYGIFPDELEDGICYINTFQESTFKDLVT